jgi:Tfp pilus assembly protein PilX
VRILNPVSKVSSRSRPISLLRSEVGISMIITLGVMLVTGSLLVAAFTSGLGEVRLTNTDTAAKKAYYAAQAGISEYAAHMTQDSNYLTYCTTPTPANKALNQLSEGTKNRVAVPGTTDEEYATTLLPAESAPAADKQCDKAHLVETMIESSGAAAGTFRVESTGFSGSEKRTLVATFRNANFVSFIWYDEYETGDPVLYGKEDESNEAKFAACGQFYGERPSYCTPFDNYFISGETIKGPMHTEDHVGISGDPVFGRNINDRIEFGHSYQGDSGYSAESGGGSASPVFVGTHVPPNEVPSLKPPPGDEELEHIVEEKYHFEDKTEIILEGNAMTVKQHVGNKAKESTSSMAFPPNGVIYVSGGCSQRYSPFGPKPGYTEDSECGNVYVHGEYTSSLTIASQNDVVINGNITTPHNSEGLPTSTAILGLIANNFVRVYHPLEGTRELEYTKCGNAKNLEKGKEPDLNKPVIYAAVLALKHSFIVDNFDCGSPRLGSLDFFGAIASLFSNGMTGVFQSGNLISGYGYAAEYDDRLQAEEPPHFLNPIQAAWYVRRETLAP